MGTKVTPARSLPRTVHVSDFAVCVSPFEHFRDSGFLVLDGIEWDGVDDVRAGLIPKRRAFDSPFHPPGMSADVGAATELMTKQAKALVDALYPQSHEFVSKSFRPMITGPEPMHFDTYPAPEPILTAFINVSRSPRVYRIGPTFARLVETQPAAVRALAAATGWEDISYRMRGQTMDGKPPMPKDGDAHLVELAPGAIWFFNGKTASHEVVYGEGALAFSWTFPGADVPTQEEMMRPLRG